MRQNIVSAFLMLMIVLLTGFTTDLNAQGRGKGHYKHGHHKHHKGHGHHYRPHDRVVHHHYYGRPAPRRTVVYAPSPRRVYVPAPPRPRVVAPVPVVVVPRHAPPLPPHPGIRRR